MATIRFQHTTLGELTGKLLTVIPMSMSSEPWVFCDDCAEASTGKRVAGWKRTGVPLSAVLGVERDEENP